MEKIFIRILVLFFSMFIVRAYSFEKLFYLTPDFMPKRILDIKNHHQFINIIAPQIYQLDENGNIRGKINPTLQAISTHYHLRMMPLIVNAYFNQAIFHGFLHSSRAENKAVLNMIALCQKNDLDGLQFDFENVNVKDKNALTQFFKLAATELHQYHFKASIVVVPRTNDNPQNDFDRWYFENWSGAYDYRSLGSIADFITLMSYDQHTSLTTPGPIAGIDWVKKTVEYLLDFVPANKISLGIPVYSGNWITGVLNPENNIPQEYTFRSKEIQISYTTAITLIKHFHASLLWKNQWKSSYSIFNQDNKNGFVFLENARSFQAKIALAKRYHLRGISVWKLGLEDPDIWKYLQFTR